jgi:plastocyanin
MAGQSWSIKIVTGTPCTFVPDVYTPPETPPPAALQAQLGDLVCWNNQTSEDHHLWLTDENYDPVSAITDKIAPWQSSYPGYVPQQADVSPAVAPNTTPTFPQTIYYYCSIHTDERGTIDVVA